MSSAHSLIIPTKAEANRTAASPVQIAFWLVLSAELMLFSGLLGAYVVLRGGNLGLFAEHAQILNHSLALSGVIAMVTSSVVIRRIVHVNKRTTIGLGGAIVLALAFLATVGSQWNTLLHRVTVGATDSSNGTQYVYDGKFVRNDDDSLVIVGQRLVASKLPDLDVHRVSDSQLRAAQENEPNGRGKFVVPNASDASVVTYGPWKNVFFSCFYLVTGVVALHVVAALCVVVVAWKQFLNGTLTPIVAQCVAWCWHFVTGIVVVTSFLLYWA